MKPEQLEALLHYRLQQAHETLRESDILPPDNLVRLNIAAH